VRHLKVAVDLKKKWAGEKGAASKAVIESARKMEAAKQSRERP